MATIKFKAYGEEQEVILRLNSYGNGRLAIESLLLDGEPWGLLTVNIPDSPVEEDEACLDTNNWEDVVQLVEEYHLGENTGKLAFSGYCVYPIYKFDRKILNTYTRTD